MSQPGAGAMADVRVVDLGLSWAAPFTGMLMADMGADVIRVESHQHLDILRWSAAFIDGVRDYENSGYYLACNRGKRSVSLNLKDQRGRELLLQLVETADVLLENFAPRVMTGLGLGGDVLHQRNPQLVIVSMSAYGATGPDSERSAYGDHLMHASGMAATTGHAEDPHTLIGTFYGDPVGGLYGAIGVLAALGRVGAGGPGEHLEYSQVEGLVSLIPTELMAGSAGDEVARLGDKSPDAVPHGFYRCRGDDTWVAVAVRSDEEWSRLAPLIGMDPGAARTLADRRQQEPAIDAAVGAWAAGRSPWEVTHACQNRDIAAYPVLSAQGLVLDDHLRKRRFFRSVHRDRTGPDLIPGVTFHMSTEADGPDRVGEQIAVRGPAPTLGEHNEEILSGILGLTSAEIEVLVAEGVVD